jgi:DNA ligase-1
VTIAQTKGSGAGKIKGDIVKKLLVQVKGEEVRYLVVSGSKRRGGRSCS